MIGAMHSHWQTRSNDDDDDYIYDEMMRHAMLVRH